VRHRPRGSTAIIGGGAAGIALRSSWRSTSQTCWSLNPAPTAFEKETQDLYDGKLLGHSQPDLQTSGLRYLGGSTNHSEGQCPPLDPMEFERLPDRPYSGWPFEFASLAPFYDRAYRYCEIGTFKQGLPHLNATTGRLFEGPKLQLTEFRYSSRPPGLASGFDPSLVPPTGSTSTSMPTSLALRPTTAGDLVPGCYLDLRHNGSRHRMKVVHENPADEIVLVAESVREVACTVEQDARVLDPTAAQDEGGGSHGQLAAVHDLGLWDPQPISALGAEKLGVNAPVVAVAGELPWVEIGVVMWWGQQKSAQQPPQPNQNLATPPFERTRDLGPLLQASLFGQYSS
jgi:hypothetical protein